MGAILLLAALVSSVQKAGAADVKFLAWKFSTSLVLVIFGALAAGLIGGCERILRDEFKDYPERALYMIGTIGEAKGKGKPG